MKKENRNEEGLLNRMAAMQIAISQRSDAVIFCGSFFLASFVAFLLLFQPSIMNSFILQLDHTTHLRSAYQFYKAVEEGVLYPRWELAAHEKLGEPIFLYYQPLFYYIVSGFNFFCSDMVMAIRATLLFSNLLLGFTSFYVLNKFILYPYAWLGMILIQVTPILFFLEIYYIALPWVFSAPFAILFARESADESPNLGRIAIWLALLVFSHIITAFMVLVSIGLCRLLCVVQNHSNERARFIRWTLGVCLGLLLSSVYLYPALTLQSLISPQGWTDASIFDWHRGFAFPTFSYFEYGHRWFPIQWPFPMLALSMMMSVFWLTNKDQNKLARISSQLALFSLVCLLLSSELAYPLYLLSGSFQKIQFPYRFIVPATLFSSMAVALYLPSLLNFRNFEWKNLLGRVSLGLTLILVVMLQIRLYDKTQDFPQLDQAMIGEFEQLKYLISTKGDHWPVYLKEGGWEGECASQKINCIHEQRTTHGWASFVSTASQTSLRLPILFFPAWKVAVDGKLIDTEPDVETGLILLSLPAGKHFIQVTWQTLVAEYIGQGLSLLGCGLILLLMFKRRVISLFKAQRVVQFIKFGVVGALGTICHYILLITIVSGFGLSPLVGTSSGAILGAIVNYCLNRSFTFQSDRKHREALPRFIILATVGLLLNVLIMWLLVDIGLFYLLAQVVATGIVLIFNYLVCKVWIFH